MCDSGDGGSGGGGSGGGGGGGSGTPWQKQNEKRGRSKKRRHKETGAFALRPADRRATTAIRPFSAAATASDLAPGIRRVRRGGGPEGTGGGGVPQEN